MLLFWYLWTIVESFVAAFTTLLRPEIGWIGRSSTWYTARHRRLFAWQAHSLVRTPLQDFTHTQRTHLHTFALRACWLGVRCTHEHTPNHTSHCGIHPMASPVLALVASGTHRTTHTHTTLRSREDSTMCGARNLAGGEAHLSTWPCSTHVAARPSRCV